MSQSKQTQVISGVKATANGVQLSPRKVAVVAALVRGRTVEEALTILEHTPRRSALAVIKVINHNHGYKPSTLRITEISVTHGPRIKRFRPAAHGRALPFVKRSSHIRVIVDGDIREVKKPASKTAKPVEATVTKKTEKETK
jgi:large subunit ribosomal protein L22